MATSLHRPIPRNSTTRTSGRQEKTADFDTAPFQPQYEWLGADARALLFDFIEECDDDHDAKVDVFAYDLDEPDVIAAICRMRKQGRLRAILDNASLHSKPGAIEIDGCQDGDRRGRSGQALGRAISGATSTTRFSSSATLTATPRRCSSAR